LLTTTYRFATPRLNRLDRIGASAMPHHTRTAHFVLVRPQLALRAQWPSSVSAAQ
jgi:hypothetical protein